MSLWTPGTVTVSDAEVVTGSDAALEIFNDIRAEEEAENPLPSLTPPSDWDGPVGEWTQQIKPMRVRLLRSWARTARAIATAGGNLGSSGGAGNLMGTFASRPAANSVSANTIYITTDGPVSFVSDGSTWKPLLYGNVVGTAPPAASNWTVYSHGGASTSFADSYGGLLLSCTNGGTGEDKRLAVWNTNVGSSFDLKVNFQMAMPIMTHQFVGFGSRQSSDGKVESLLWHGANNGNNSWERRRSTASNTSTSPTYSYSSEVVRSVTWAHNTVGAWARIVQTNGGNRTFYTSINGIDWSIIAGMTCAYNDFFVPDQVYIDLFSSDSGGPHTLSNRIISWSLS